MAFWRRILPARRRPGAGRLHGARHRDGVRQGARLRDRRRRSRRPSAASAASARASATCSRARSPTSRRSSTTARSPSRRPRRWPASGRARSSSASPASSSRASRRRHSQERKKPDQPISEARAPEARSTASSARRCARPSARSPGRPGLPQRRRPARPRGRRRRVDRRLRADEPGRVPGPAREDRDLQRVRAARPPRRAPERRQRSSTSSSLEVVAEPYAVARVLGAEQVRQAGALFVDVGGGTTDVALVRSGRHRGHADVRARRAGVHEVARRPARPAVPAGRVGSRSTTPAGSPVERRDEIAEIIADDVEVWAAGVELVMEELGGGDLLPGRIYLCGGGSRLPEIRAALAAERFWKRLSVRPAARGRR